MNARLRKCFPGEDIYIGPHFFKGIEKEPHATANRFMLMEFCVEMELALANTFFDLPDHQLVTYYELAATPMEEVWPNRFAQLDYCLCPLSWMSNIKTIYSNRTVSLSSHHFLLHCMFSAPMQLAKVSKSHVQTRRLNFSCLSDHSIGRAVVSTFNSSWKMEGTKDNDELTIYSNAILWATLEQHPPP